MDLYHQNIIDHYKTPSNYGEMKGYSLVRAEYNPTCGDRLVLYMKLDENRVVDVSFTGSGCAISMAAASMLTEVIKGKTIEEVLDISKEGILEMLCTSINAGRLKCALLAWTGVREMLKP
ncbi:MAG: nitrogen fixation protein NifU [Parcubacteria group bacterium Gr01-1014_18]|nr:MAG: nitrogen fixation protein NifU [Parcubacteria group bacterium Greene0416_36]TSC80710.1 MAG: nitrogen fixation protein NifU [Parcubacteria group bacterium Gr01-1014_18]TSC98679.1 MAG: nitrogen fixation protein NifU [Parcubacteria group bacterium Greene1014_20]TSD07161.1 MAG: nitrogen fixation protein NifU [Parcubacteria group bacterium Greene0714_2]